MDQRQHSRRTVVKTGLAVLVSPLAARSAPLIFIPAERQAIRRIELGWHVNLPAVHRGEDLISRWLAGSIEWVAGVTGKVSPDSCVAGGHVHRWQHGLDTLDNLVAVLDYGAFTVHCSASLTDDSQGLYRRIFIEGGSIHRPTDAHVVTFVPQDRRVGHRMVLMAAETHRRVFADSVHMA